VSLLKDIKLTEEQAKEVEISLEAWRKETAAAMESEFKAKLEESAKNSDKSRVTADGADLELKEDEAAVLQKKLVEWKEKISEEAEEKLGEKFFNIYKKGESKLRKEYSDKFVTTLKEMYTEVETKVREKLVESTEFKAFSEMKKLMAPFIVEGSLGNTVVEDVAKLKTVIKEQAEKIESVKIKSKLDQLTEGMPDSLKEQFISNLGSIKNENELIEAFHRNVKLIKQVKDQIINELNESSNTKAEEKKPEVKAPVVTEAAAPAKAVVTKVVPAEEVKKPAKVLKESVSHVEEPVEYDILSEDFKRVETKKTDNMRRIRELAGLE
jgi:hypothetical protein